MMRMGSERSNEVELEAFAEWRTTYESCSRSLPGFFVTPPGDGPFPGIVFHHGSGGLLAAARPAAEALVRMGYAVYLAVRRGHNGAPGPFWESLVSARWGSPEMGRQLVAALSGECDDAVAALECLKANPLVDPNRIAMIGSSYGGVMVMLAAARGAAFRAGVSFAGPSITWPDAPALQATLVDAVRLTNVPLLLIQAGDDFHLTPTYVLGGELARLGKPHETRIYQPIGSQRGDGHRVFNTAVSLWEPDVRRFLARWLPAS
jgi:dienelactone hydrolase